MSKEPLVFRLVAGFSSFCCLKKRFLSVHAGWRCSKHPVLNRQESAVANRTYK
ncbi:hypothetical protein HMPREF3213_03858 [Heyndrickxia coagulans]|uniref:Uncharacterized protein n=1 Tax=Heyndrickxia coagulans TaxID=1398 RepID=A0A133K9R7_HEYCO|nr:hypothetical protein HMPREF3213_03858 [Heyndrickxia coagulans]